MSTTTAAPDLETLHDFETQIETAAREILRRAGLTVIDPFVYVDPAASEPQKQPDESVVVEIDIGPATGDRGLKNATGTNGDYDGESEYNVYEGQLSIVGSVAFTPPAEQGGPPDFVQTLRRNRAKCRVAFMESRTPFTGELLPWLDVLRLQPARPQRRVDAPRGVNQFELFWDIRLAIRSTAWPAGA